MKLDFVNIRKWEYWPLFTLIVLCIIIFGFGLMITFSLGNGKPDSANEIGDSAGAINGLVSALAFAGVIFAIILQKKELSLQRHELEQTRQELTAQKEEFEEQNKTLRHQRFEDTFFNMMHLHQNIIDSLYYVLIVNIRQEDGSFKECKEEFHGRDVFKAIFENAPVNNLEEESDSYIGMRNYLLQYGLEGYEKTDYPNMFDHYFRHLYRILKFVTTSQLIEDDERYDYAALLRGQLSRYELVWLYYNGLTYGKQKLRPYLQTYAMLKNLRKEMLVKEIKIEDGYTIAAFYHQN